MSDSEREAAESVDREAVLALVAQLEQDLTEVESAMAAVEAGDHDTATSAVERLEQLPSDVPPE